MKRITQIVLTMAVAAGIALFGFGCEGNGEKTDGSSTQPAHSHGSSTQPHSH